MWNMTSFMITILKRNKTAQLFKILIMAKLRLAFACFWS